MGASLQLVRCKKQARECYIFSRPAAGELFIPGRQPFLNVTNLSRFRHGIATGTGHKHPGARLSGVRHWSSFAGRTAGFGLSVFVPTARQN